MDYRSFCNHVGALSSLYSSEIFGLYPTSNVNKMIEFLRVATDDLITFSKNDENLFSFDKSVDFSKSTLGPRFKKITDIFPDGNIFCPDAFDSNLRLYEIKTRGTNPSSSIPFLQIEKYTELSERFDSDLMLVFSYYDFLGKKDISSIKDPSKIKDNIYFQEFFVVPWSVVRSKIPEYLKKKDVNKQYFGVSYKLLREIYDSDGFKTKTKHLKINGSHKADIIITENGKNLSDIYHTISRNRKKIEKEGFSITWDKKQEKYISAKPLDIFKPED